MDVVQNSWSIFVPSPIDNSIQREYYVEFNPIVAISKSGAIEYNIPVTSLDYIYLSKTKLHIKYIITTKKEVPIQDIRDINRKPTDESDQVGPVNFPLHTILGKFIIHLIKNLFLQILELIILIRQLLMLCLILTIK